MADTNISVKDSAGNIVPVDARTNPDNELRQVVVIGDGENAGLVDLDGHLGQDGTSPPTLAGSGLRGWLRGIYERLGGTLTVHVDNETAAVDVSALAQDLTLSTGLGGPGSAPPGLPGNGSGLLGFLRAIRDLLAGTLTVSGTVTPAVAGDVATTLTGGRASVTTAGTRVPLVGSSTPCKWALVTARTSNTQQINVGGATVVAAQGSTTGVPLTAGQSVSIPIDNANKIFVDARVNGEGVDYLLGS